MKQELIDLNEGPKRNKKIKLLHRKNNKILVNMTIVQLTPFVILLILFLIIKGTCKY